MKDGANPSIKRIYEPPTKDDGARVLVDRIWPRGVTKEEAKLDLWLKAIAPSAALRKWYGHDPAKWTEFRRRYRAELAENPEPVAELKALMAKGPVTLLFAAHDEAHSHAAVLQEFVQAG